MSPPSQLDTSLLEMTGELPPHDTLTWLCPRVQRRLFCCHNLAPQAAAAAGKALVYGGLGSLLAGLHVLLNKDISNYSDAAADATTYAIAAMLLIASALAGIAYSPGVLAPQFFDDPQKVSAIFHRAQFYALIWGWIPTLALGSSKFWLPLLPFDPAASIVAGDFLFSQSLSTIPMVLFLILNDFLYHIKKIRWFPLLLGATLLGTYLASRYLFDLFNSLNPLTIGASLSFSYLSAFILCITFVYSCQNDFKLSFCKKGSDFDYTDQNGQTSNFFKQLNKLCIWILTSKIAEWGSQFFWSFIISNFTNIPIALAFLPGFELVGILTALINRITLPVASFVGIFHQNIHSAIEAQNWNEAKKRLKQLKYFMGFVFVGGLGISAGAAGFTIHYLPAFTQIFLNTSDPVVVAQANQSKFLAELNDFGFCTDTARLLIGAILLGFGKMNTVALTNLCVVLLPFGLLCIVLAMTIGPTGTTNTTINTNTTDQNDTSAIATYTSLTRIATTAIAAGIFSGLAVKEICKLTKKIATKEEQAQTAAIGL